MLTYGVGGVLTKSINILLVPIFTRVLIPADYGSLDLIYIAGSLFAILYGFMIGSGYVREFFSHKSAEERQRLFGSAYWFTLGNVIIFLILIYLFSDQIASVAFDFSSGSQYLLMRVMIVMVL